MSKVPILDGPIKLGALVSLCEQSSATFTELRDELNATDGNLSVQLRRLESAGYIVRRRTGPVGQQRGTGCHSHFSITRHGRTALIAHLQAMAALLARVESRKEKAS